ncbi:MAG: hypothetical protein NTW78_02075 [Campylobacterales bacterium]|nr:hypothetical protein [Campylobacterales bacterium]
MLGRLLIGGITLAAVGYGLKKYCDEEGCFEEKEQRLITDLLGEESEKKNKLTELHQLKISVYSDVFSEFNSLFSEINNIEQRIEKYGKIAFKKEVSQDDSPSAEILTRADEFITALRNAKILFEINIEDLQKIVTQSTDFYTYSQQDKELIDNMFSHANIIGELCHTKIISEDGGVTEESQEAAQKISEYIKF